MVPRDLYLKPETVNTMSARDYRRKLPRLVEWAKVHDCSEKSNDELDFPPYEYFDLRLFEVRTSREGPAVLAVSAYFTAATNEETSLTYLPSTPAPRSWTRIGCPAPRWPFALMLLYPVMAILIFRNLLAHAPPLPVQHQQVVNSDLGLPAKAGMMDKSVANAGRHAEAPPWPFDLATHGPKLKQASVHRCTKEATLIAELHEVEHHVLKYGKLPEGHALTPFVSPSAVPSLCLRPQHVQTKI